MQKLNAKSVNEFKIAAILIFIGSICVLVGFFGLKVGLIKTIILMVGIFCNSIGVIISTTIIGNSIMGYDSAKIKSNKKANDYGKD